MGLWNYCEVCGERIETGQPCIGVKEESENLCGDSICLKCAKIENLADGKEPLPITDLLVRAEAAEKEVARLCESLDFARTKDAEIVRLGQALSRAEERAEKAEKCISEIEDALRFGRYSAAMLRISEWRGQKEE